MRCTGQPLQGFDKGGVCSLGLKEKRELYRKNLHPSAGIEFLFAQVVRVYSTVIPERFSGSLKGVISLTLRGFVT